MIRRRRHKKGKNDQIEGILSRLFKHGNKNLKCGKSYYYKGEYEEALICLKRGLKQLRPSSSSDSTDLNVTYILLGETYEKLNKRKEAIYYYTQALDNFRLNDENESYSVSFEKERATLLKYLSKLGNIHLSIAMSEKHEVRLRNCKQAIDTYTEYFERQQDVLQDSTASLSVLINLIKARGVLSGLYINENKHNLAIMACTTSLETCQEHMALYFSSNGDNILENEGRQEGEDEVQDNFHLLQQLLHNYFKTAIRLSYLYLHMQIYDATQDMLLQVLDTIGVRKPDFLLSLSKSTLHFELDLPNRQYIAKILHNLGMIYQKKELYQDSIPILNQTLNLLHSVEHETHESGLKGKQKEEITLALLSLGESYYSINYDSQALYFLSQTVEQFRSHQELAFTYDEFFPVYRKIFTLHLKRNEIDTCIVFLQDMLRMPQLSSKHSHFKKSPFYLEISMLYSHLSKLLCENEQYDKALDTIQLSLNCIRKYKYHNHCCSSILYRDIAVIYQKKNDYSRSLEYFQKSLKGLHQKSFLNILVLERIGFTYCLLQQYQEGIHSFQLAFTAVKSKYDNDINVLLLNNMGNALMLAGNIEIARNHYISAYSHSTNPTKFKTLDNRNILYNIGLAHYKQGEFNAAKDKFEELIKLQLNDVLMFDDEHNINLASVLNMIGNIYYLNNNVEEAIEWYQQSLELKENFHREEILERKSGTLHNLGKSYTRLSQLPVALSYLEQSLNCIDIRQGKNKHRLASLYNTFGVVHMKRKDYHKAISYFNMSLEYKQSIHDTNSLQVLNTKQNIALAHAKKQNFKLAKELLNEVYISKLTKLGKDHVDIAKILLDMCSLSFKLNDYHEASKFHKRALNILVDSHLPSSHPVMKQAKNYRHNKRFKIKKII